jgi:hypothetical protein
VLQKAYNARSAAAHQGTLNDEKTVAAVDEAEPLCAKIIEKLLACGHFPDWKVLTLGGMRTNRLRI